MAMDAMFYSMAGALNTAIHAVRATTTANEITAAACVFKILTLCLMFRAERGARAAAAAVVAALIAYILDCADGLWARTHGQCSEAGAAFDHISDLLYGIALGVAFLTVAHPPWWTILVASLIFVYSTFGRACKAAAKHVSAVTRGDDKQMFDPTWFPQYTMCPVVTGQWRGLLGDGELNAWILVMIGYSLYGPRLK